MRIQKYFLCIVLFIVKIDKLDSLIAKNISPVLNEVLNSVIKCINAIKAFAKCERLFKLLYFVKNKSLQTM